jgi:hypothetical protein
VLQLAQFVNVFAPVFNFAPDTGLTPDDIAHAIKYPDLDPICGVVVTRMLARKIARVEADTTIPPPRYQQWNEQLAKKFSVLHKTYIKFHQKHSSVPAEGDDAREQDSIETDVMENLTQYAGPDKYQKKFVSQYATMLKTEILQTVKLFEHELEGQDPFYIESEEKPEPKPKQKNIYESNFIDPDAIDDLDALEEMAYQ